jgi:hypothetical protein
MAKIAPGIALRKLPVLGVHYALTRQFFAMEQATNLGGCGSGRSNTDWAG